MIVILFVVNIAYKLMIQQNEYKVEVVNTHNLFKDNDNE